MLTVLILDGEAYGVTIGAEINRRMSRLISRGALHTALSRLEEKGLIRSKYGEPTAERGGRRKRIYEVTDSGVRSLQEAKDLREGMWTLIPKLS